MSFSWADPNFAALFAAREEERMMDRFLEQARREYERAAAVAASDWGSPFAKLDEIELPTPPRFL